MSIIISKKGQIAQKLDKSDFEKEDYLQDYIHKNPESIPVYEIEEKKRLFVVKREFETNSGPIDALAIDKDGDIYIVETKLYKNPDKRTVVAQALDYGSALWRHLNDFQEFVNILDAECEKNFKQTFKEKVGDFFKLEDEEIENLLDLMRRNLADGSLKFVILMDSMDERLKDLIVYVNQNSQFDIYAVQLEYYKFNDYEIMIPKLFGVEVKKNMKTAQGGTRRKWTKEDFLLDTKQKTDSETTSVIKDILDFSYKNADKVTYGTGNEGVFSYKLDTSNGEITPFFVKSNGAIKFSLGWVKAQKKVADELVERLIERLSEIKDASVMRDNNPEDIKIFLDIRKLEKNSIDNFKKAVLEFTDGVRGSL